MRKFFVMTVNQTFPLLLEGFDALPPDLAFELQPASSLDSTVNHLGQDFEDGDVYQADDMSFDPVNDRTT